MCLGSTEASFDEKVVKAIAEVERRGRWRRFCDLVGADVIML